MSTTEISLQLFCNLQCEMEWLGIHPHKKSINNGTFGESKKKFSWFSGSSAQVDDWFIQLGTGTDVIDWERFLFYFIKILWA